MPGMSYKKYTVYGMFGVVGFLVIYGSNCNVSLLPEQVAEIARQVFDPYCYVRSYNIEPEGPGFPYIPFQTPSMSVTTSGTAASNVSLSNVVFGTSLK